ncbi:SDR family oxidoreductase [Paraglaciecola sp. L3A3]|uniref:SDR family oxidoreductase n=1 Tax=Paraglaciecola sp. L3A3 TaxID=2686358 RepID=UPI00131AD116|nr:SDR family oxidoreductase [Paraglaciecola sp. L3A3]
MKTVVITGANRGIGLEFVKQYLILGYKVIALCRNSSDELTKSGAQVVDKVDVGNPECLAKVLPALGDIKIDVLINNAGVFSNETLTDMSVATMEYQLRVNSMGPVLVTQLLKYKLVKGAKVALITSRMGSVTDNTSGGYYGYRMSKAALNAAGVSLAHDLKDFGVSVALLHPGFVQTEMVNYNGDISAADSAKKLIQRIEELNLTNSGTFWHSNGEVLPW